MKGGRCALLVVLWAALVSGQMLMSKGGTEMEAEFRAEAAAARAENEGYLAGNKQGSNYSQGKRITPVEK
ncbi:unnamed protein product, partial [Chrysoparadoxa australica]